MKSFKKLTEELINEGSDMMPADEMTMKEVKIACYAAHNILDRLESGSMIQRWQISAIVKASEELASVYTSMSADEMDDEDEDENEYVGYEYPSMYGEEVELDEGPFKGIGKMMMKRKLQKQVDTHTDNMYDNPKEFGDEYDRRTRKQKALDRLKKEETDLEEADGTKRNRELFATGRISKDEFDKRMGYGKYKTKDNSKKLDGPGGLYKNLVKKLGEETDYKVTVDGLPDMYVKADSPSEVKNSLRKVVKNPEMIKNVERIAKASLQKMFRDKASGKEE